MTRCHDGSEAGVEPGSAEAALGSAWFVPGIPRLGVPTLQETDAELGVANPGDIRRGDTATVEAVNLAIAATGRNTVWVSAGLNPRWRQALVTLGAGKGVRVVDVPLVDGRTSWERAAAEHDAGDVPAALVAASPNYLGCIDPLGPARKAADNLGAVLVAVLSAMLGLDMRETLPIFPAAIVLIALASPPKLRRWRLTGRHRLVPAIPKTSQDYVQVG